MNAFQTALENIQKFAAILKSYILKLYNMFYSTTPEDVEIDKLDNDNNITTTTVPNLAKIKQTFDTWKGTVQPQINALQAELAHQAHLNIEETAATGSITTSSGYDKVIGYAIDLSSANASSPSTSIVTATTKTDFSTPISLSGFYPMETAVQEILGWDDAPINFAKIAGRFIFEVDSTAPNTSMRGKRGCLDLEIGHDAGEVKAINNFSFGYNENYPENSLMQILVAEKGATSKIWIKPPASGSHITAASDLKIIL